MSTTTRVTRGLLAGVGAAGATLMLLLSGCGDPSTDTAAGTSTHEHGASQADHNGADHAADHATDHDAADVAFATAMIPHHQQAIVVSDIVLGKEGIDARVVDLARQIKAAQDPEITTMRQWLQDWGAPAPVAHEGHDMGAMGMMSEQQLEQLRQAQGVDAARLFLDGMIAHHEGAVKMSQTEVDSGKSDAAVHLARQIIETQQREIDTMKQILGSL